MKKLLLFFPLAMLWACELTNVQPTQPVQPSSTMNDLVVPTNFDFATQRAVEVRIESPVPQSTFSLYGSEGEELLKGQTDKKGQFYQSITLPSTSTHLTANFAWVGSPTTYDMPITGNKALLHIQKQGRMAGGRMASTARTSASITGKYYSMGTWDSQGKPDYLMPTNDNIPQALLDDINATLPEGRPVPQYNPEYLTENSMDVQLGELADVWVTFVHEGAGYKNTLGYYTYPLANPPASTAAIDSFFIIFPNVSFTGSGGSMTSGNKVYLGKFPANTGIGWFLIPNGWDGANATIIPKTDTKYAEKDLNTFAVAQYRQHTVLMKDNVRELLLLGIEDISRPGGDNDFNDAIFYISANPYSALLTNTLLQIDQAIDTDGDGVLDHLDEYPSDAARAFNAYSPAKDVFGSISFEDLWPNKGDYDFNDLVVDYNYQRVLSSSNQVQEMVMKVKIKAIGGYYKNGFGVELPCLPNQVLSVTGHQLKENYISLDANGTESGQSKATIIAFDNAFALMSPPPGKRLVNAESGSPYITPVTLTINVDFVNNTLTESQFSASPYNPFLIASMQRGKEIHLSGKQPTALAQTNLFGTGNDASAPASNVYYKTSQSHPWAIHLPRTFEYPRENADITQVHSNFASWASSGGTQFADWYTNKAGYRNVALLYTP